MPLRAYTAYSIQRIGNTKKIIDNGSKQNNEFIITGGDINCLV